MRKVFASFWLALLLAADGRAQTAPAGGATVDQLYQRGCLALAMGDYASAIAALQGAVAAEPGNQKLIVQLAEAYQLVGKFDEADAILATAAEIRADAAPVEIAIAKLRARQGRWPEAAERFAPHALSLTDVEMAAFVRALRRTGQETLAERWLRHAVERWPQAAALHELYIEGPLARQRYASALQRVLAAEKAAGHRPEFDALAARALLGKGAALGRVHIVEAPGGAVGQRTDDGVLFASAGPQRFRACAPESAMYRARLALDAGLTAPSVWAIYARCWAEAGDAATGWRLLQPHLTELDEEVADDVLQSAAEAALAAGALSEYAALVERRFEGDEPAAIAARFAAYRTLAEQYNLRGDGAMAIGFLKRALELRPDDGVIRLRLADELWAEGAEAEAGAEYHILLTQLPTHARRREMLERLAESGYRPAQAAQK